MRLLTGPSLIPEDEVDPDQYPSRLERGKAKFKRRMSSLGEVWEGRREIRPAAPAALPQSMQPRQLSLEPIRVTVPALPHPPLCEALLSESVT